MEYEAKDDITETLEDGRTIQVAVKGQRIPMEEAERLGLVKGQQKAEPSETKQSADTTKVSEAKSSSKSKK